MHHEALQGIVEKIAHFLCRLNTQRKVYKEQDGQLVELDFAAIVKFMRKKDIKQYEGHITTLATYQDHSVAVENKVNCPVL